ncbi:GNAT family N-acetyltransferase [Clostridium tunisiense]|uniref:GNAT family N-acetyltransferase n=1 Tax=Clostridium tunisiense TaxID=219748 RepID=UPI00178C7648|nr:GNAT family N-acetyltransferase [Clostridium tunisiense]
MKVKMNKAIRDFLESDLIYNLNVLGVIDNMPDAEIYVDDEEAPKGVMVRKDYFNYIYSEDDKFIDEMLESHFVEGFFGFSGLKKSIADKIRTRFMNSWESKCNLYYLPEEALDLSLIKTPVRDIDVKDAEVVDKYYTYRSPWSIHEIREDITNRPSSAVYVDGNIACWVLIHKDDSMGIMYTKEEHRQKGYAVDVTIDLAEKIIKRGKIPYLQIVEGNSMSPGLANKCGFIPYGKCEWFGINVGFPKETVEASKKGKEIFIENLLEPLKNRLRIDNITENHGYNTMFELDKITCKVDDFKVEEVKDKENIKKWCEIVTSAYCNNKEEFKVFNDELFATMTKEELPFTLYLGYLNGKVVSATSTVRFEEVSYFYFTTVLEEAKNREIEMATIIEASRLEMEKDMELVIVQTCKEKIDLYEELGFVFIPEEKLV